MLINNQVTTVKSCHLVHIRMQYMPTTSETQVATQSFNFKMNWVEDSINQPYHANILYMLFVENSSQGLWIRCVSRAVQSKPLAS